MMEHPVPSTALEKPRPTSAMGNLHADMIKTAGPPCPRTLSENIKCHCLSVQLNKFCCICHLSDCTLYVLCIIYYRCLASSTLASPTANRLSMRVASIHSSNLSNIFGIGMLVEHETVLLMILQISSREIALLCYHNQGISIVVYDLSLYCLWISQIRPANR